MSSRSGFSGAQFAVLLVVVALVAAVWGLLLILLRPAAAAETPTLTPTPPASSTPLPSITLTATEPPTPTATATVTLTPSPTPLVPLACLPADAERVEAQVRAVVSGSVIEVEMNGVRSFVRYLGVDPAGDGQPSSLLNRSLVDGQVVTLIRDAGDQDARGYLLRYVLIGDTFVNFELVRQGTALVALFPPIQTCVDTLLAGEELARQEQLGFWALAAGTPLAPGELPGAASCDCRVRYACTDFSSQADAQACYNACGDYRNASLDPDHNGLACDE